MQKNVPISHSARQVRASDFTSFDYILAADGSNLRALERHVGHSEGSKATVKLWGSYLPDNKPIPDPYYGGLVSRSYYYHQQRIGLRNGACAGWVQKGLRAVREAFKRISRRGRWEEELRERSTIQRMGMDKDRGKEQAGNSKITHIMIIPLWYAQIGISEITIGAPSMYLPDADLVGFVVKQYYAI